MLNIKIEESDDKKNNHDSFECRYIVSFNGEDSNGNGYFEGKIEIVGWGREKTEAKYECDKRFSEFKKGIGNLQNNPTNIVITEAVGLAQ